MPSSRDLPSPGTESVSAMSPALAGGFLTTSATWEAHWWECKMVQLLWRTVVTTLQKVKHMEEDREPRNEPTHLSSVNL